jgi:phage antirepressor YoqD-like protein
MAQQIKYIEYNGQPVISARDLYAFLLEGKGNDVSAWVMYCSNNAMMVEWDDFYKIKTPQGHPDVLMVPTCAAVMCNSFSKEERAKSAYNYIRNLSCIKTEISKNDDVSSDGSTSITISEAAKILCPDKGPRYLYKFLMDSMVLMASNVPYQRYMNNGYFKVVNSVYNHPDGSAYHYSKTFVTEKGLNYLKTIINNSKVLVAA